MELGLSVRWFGKRKEAKPDPMRFLIQAVCGIEPDLSDLHIQRGETVTPACLPACQGDLNNFSNLKKKKKKRSMQLPEALNLIYKGIFSLAWCRQEH